jgi:hypothetical protein
MRECCDVSRPPLPASTFVTIAIRPSVRGGMRGKMRPICPTRQAEYFRREDWTGGIALKAREKFVFARSRFYVLQAVRTRDERTGLIRLPDEANRVGRLSASAIHDRQRVRSTMTGFTSFNPPCAFCSPSPCNCSTRTSCRRVCRCLYAALGSSDSARGAPPPDRRRPREVSKSLHERTCWRHVGWAF